MDGQRDNRTIVENNAGRRLNEIILQNIIRVDKLLRAFAERYIMIWKLTESLSSC